MDALQMTLLFDYYGELLTDRQRMCFDLRHNQDLSLAEIAQELNFSDIYHFSKTFKRFTV